MIFIDVLSQTNVEQVSKCILDMELNLTWVRFNRFRLLFKTPNNVVKLTGIKKLVPIRAF